MLADVAGPVLEVDPAQDGLCEGRDVIKCRYNYFRRTSSANAFSRCP